MTEPITLPRGALYVSTPAGAVQFGVPPETIKDSMRLGLDVAAVFVQGLNGARVGLENTRRIEVPPPKHQEALALLDVFCSGRSLPRFPPLARPDLLRFFPDNPGVLVSFLGMSFVE
ncbi:MAG: hypothetical protein WKG00_26735 [Polyangiaceae bacterium]